MALSKEIRDVDRYRKSLEEMVKCPICRKTCKDPVITTCQHSFCRICIHAVLQKDSAFGTVNVGCPVCRKNIHITNIYTPFECLPSSIYVTQLIDILNANKSDSDALCDFCENTFAEAVEFCSPCKKRICSKCCCVHKKSKRSHSVTLLENDRVKSKFCLKHIETEIDSFCCEIGCNIPICKRCDERDHKYHNKISLAEKARQYSDDAKSCEIEQKTRIGKLEKCINSLLKKIENLDKEAKLATSDIEETTAAIKLKVDEKMKFHLKEVEDKSSDEKRSLGILLEKVGTEFALRKSMLLKIEALPKQHSAIIVRETPPLIEQYKGIHETDIDMNLDFKYFCLRFIPAIQIPASITRHGLGEIACNSADDTSYLGQTSRYDVQSQSEITRGNEENFSEFSSYLSISNHLDEASMMNQRKRLPFSDRKPIGKIDERVALYISSVQRSQGIHPENQ